MDKHVHRSREGTNVNVFTDDPGFILTHTNALYTARMVWIERCMDGTASLQPLRILYNLLLEDKGVRHHFEKEIANCELNPQANIDNIFCIRDTYKSCCSLHR